MLNGKQIRITFKEATDDGWDPPGWSKQELWRYNKQKDLFECSYPISSYDKNFYTTYDKKTADAVMHEYMTEWSSYDDGIVESIKAEDDPVCSIDGGKSIKEMSIEKIKDMSDDEIIRVLFI